MIHKQHHSPMVIRSTFFLRRVHDYDECYILSGKESKSLHMSLYHGEREITQLFGQDTFAGGGWRGCLTDGWGVDFHYDFLSALKWLHESEDSIDDTLFLWTNYIPEEE